LPRPDLAGQQRPEFKFASIGLLLLKQLHTCLQRGWMMDGIFQKGRVAVKRLS
jgi:hypothetical protein